MIGHVIIQILLVLIRIMRELMVHITILARYKTSFNKWITTTVIMVMNRSKILNPLNITFCVSLITLLIVRWWLCLFIFRMTHWISQVASRWCITISSHYSINVLRNLNLSTTHSTLNDVLFYISVLNIWYLCLSLWATLSDSLDYYLFIISWWFFLIWLLSFVNF